MSGLVGRSSCSADFVWEIAEFERPPHSDTHHTTTVEFRFARSFRVQYSHLPLPLDEVVARPGMVAWSDDSPKSSTLYV